MKTETPRVTRLLLVSFLGGAIVYAFLETLLDGGFIAQALLLPVVPVAWLLAVIWPGAVRVSDVDSSGFLLIRAMSFGILIAGVVYPIVKWKGVARYCSLAYVAFALFAFGLFFWALNSGWTD